MVKGGRSTSHRWLKALTQIHIRDSSQMDICWILLCNRLNRLTSEDMVTGE